MMRVTVTTAQGSDIYEHVTRVNTSHDSLIGIVLDASTHIYPTAQVRRIDAVDEPAEPVRSGTDERKR